MIRRGYARIDLYVLLEITVGKLGTGRALNNRLALCFWLYIAAKKAQEAACFQF